MTAYSPTPTSEQGDARWPWPGAGTPGLPATVAEGTSPPPDWVRDAIRRYFGDIRDWVVQAWSLFVAPRRFMEEWSTGRRAAIDPLAFLAAGSALKALASRCGQHFLHVKLPSNGITDWLHSSLGTTALLFVVGGASHLVLRRRSRAPLRSTVAALAYTSGGPGALIGCVGWAVSILLRLAHRDPSFVFYGATLPAPVIAGAYLSYAWTLAALAGAHRVRWIWVVLAVLTAVALPFLLIGLGVFLQTLDHQLQ